MLDRSSTFRLTLLAGALFIVSTNSLNIAGLLPDIAETLGVSVGSVGYGITVYAVVAAIASPVLAAILSRRSRTVVLACGLAVVAVGTMASALAPDLSWFIGGRAVAALAAVGLGFTAASALG